MRFGESIATRSESVPSLEERRRGMLAKSASFFETMKSRVAAHPLAKALLGAVLLTSVEGCGALQHGNITFAINAPVPPDWIGFGVDSSSLEASKASNTVQAKTTIEQAASGEMVKLEDGRLGMVLRERIARPAFDAKGKGEGVGEVQYRAAYERALSRINRKLQEIGEHGLALADVPTPETIPHAFIESESRRVAKEMKELHTLFGRYPDTAPAPVLARLEKASWERYEIEGSLIALEQEYQTVDVDGKSAQAKQYHRLSAELQHAYDRVSEQIVKDHALIEESVQAGLERASGSTSEVNDRQAQRCADHRKMGGLLLAFEARDEQRLTAEDRNNFRIISRDLTLNIVNLEQEEAELMTAASKSGSASGAQTDVRERSLIHQRIEMLKRERQALLSSWEESRLIRVMLARFESVQIPESFADERFEVAFAFPLVEKKDMLEGEIVERSVPRDATGYPDATYAESKLASGETAVNVTLDFHNLHYSSPCHFDKSKQTSDAIARIKLVRFREYMMRFLESQLPKRVHQETVKKYGLKGISAEWLWILDTVSWQLQLIPVPPPTDDPLKQQMIMDQIMKQYHIKQGRVITTTAESYEALRTWSMQPEHRVRVVIPADQTIPRISVLSDEGEIMGRARAASTPSKADQQRINRRAPRDSLRF